MGVDCEVRAGAALRAGWTGTEQLDAFADVGQRLRRASRRRGEAGCSPQSVVYWTYLDAAAVVEKGLPPAQIVSRQNRVQVLTVHAAKGLEWQVEWASAPTCQAGVFPVDGPGLGLGSPTPPTFRRCSARLIVPRRVVHGVPILDTSDCDRSEAAVGQDLRAPSRAGGTPRRRGRRRLLYVAITRARGPPCCCPATTGAPPDQGRAGHRISCASLKDIIEGSAAAGQPCGVIEHWAPSAGGR